MYRDAGVWDEDPIDLSHRHVHRGVVARLMVLVRPPRRLEPDDAEGWLRQQLASVVGDAGVRSAALSRLASASLHWSQDSGWLLEFDFETAERAREALREAAWSMLLGDLRLLGMSATVALVDGSEELKR
jgi:hypothetical protein